MRASAPTAAAAVTSPLPLAAGTCTCYATDCLYCSPTAYLQALVKAAEQRQQRAERKRGAQAAELHSQAVVSSESGGSVEAWPADYPCISAGEACEDRCLLRLPV